jgi:hypothetical protein
MTGAAKAQPIAAPTPASDVLWWALTVNTTGWDYVDEGQGALVLAKTANPSVVDGKMRRWIRYEFKTPNAPGGPQSMVTLFEFDCDGGKDRSLQSTSYYGPNMSGQAVTTSNTDLWLYPTPDTLGESAFKYSCTK